MSYGQKQQKPLDNYITVAERIEHFYDRFPEGRIITQIIEHDQESGFVLMRAEVYRNPDDAQPAATGHAYEIKGQGFVNNTSHIENCETGCVGRALANLGFEVKRGIASREEMQKVERMQTRPQAVPAAEPPVSENAEPIDWHQEIGILCKKLRAFGNADFKDGAAMKAYFKEWATRKKFAEKILQVEKISDIPPSTARAYAGVLTDLVEAAKESS